MKIADLHQDLYCHYKYPEISKHEFVVLDLIVGAMWAYKLNKEPFTESEALSELKKYKEWLESKGFYIVYDKTDLYVDKPKIILALEWIEFKDPKPFYEEGVKIVGPWNNSSIGGTIFNKYLTKEDKQFLENISKYFILDLSHASYETKYFILKKDYEVIFSHVGVKKLIYDEQNIGNLEIDIVKQKKSLIGLSFYKQHTNFDFRKHFDWLVDNLGIEYVAIGSDWYGFPKQDGISWDDIKKILDNKEIEILYENVIKFLEKNLK